MEVFANVVGVTFRSVEAKEIVKRMTPDDGELLSLETEPDNDYDCYAVKVIYKPTGTHIGYLGRDNNLAVFQALDRGDPVTIKIVGFENTIKPTLLITDFDENVTLSELGME
jgi:hypothetical protein